MECADGREPLHAGGNFQQFECTAGRGSVDDDEAIGRGLVREDTYPLEDQKRFKPGERRRNEGERAALEHPPRDHF